MTRQRRRPRRPAKLWWSAVAIALCAAAGSLLWGAVFLTSETQGESWTDWAVRSAVGVLLASMNRAADPPSPNRTAAQFPLTVPVYEGRLPGSTYRHHRSATRGSLPRWHSQVARFHRGMGLHKHPTGVDKLRLAASHLMPRPTTRPPIGPTGSQSWACSGSALSVLRSMSIEPTATSFPEWPGAMTLM